LQSDFNTIAGFDKKLNVTEKGEEFKQEERLK